MRVAIIGAGPAGLASAKQVTAEEIECEVFEMKSELGGTWVYSEETGTDQYGFPIYSATYKNLRANLPQFLMMYPDFSIPEKEKSYETQAELLEYLNLYADHFKLRQLIRFNRMVTEVFPLDGGKWRVKSVDKPTKQEFSAIFDAVMVCCGNWNEPFWGRIPGEEKFKGKIIHSQQYRLPETFTNLKVLVIGAGPSGFDLTCDIALAAKHVVFSHHNEQAANMKFTPNVRVKPDVLRVIDGESVEFNDKSCESFDAIVYCTGYNYSFPFLHEKCGVTVDDNYVQPLYKHMIHIDRPTMWFIGIPLYVCAFIVFNLQTRIFCKYLKKDLTLPSPDEMRRQTEKDMQNQWVKGYSKRKAHLMFLDQQSYYDDLTTFADLEPIAPVYAKMLIDSQRRFHEDFLHYRDDKYIVTDNENFVVLESS